VPTISRFAPDDAEAVAALCRAEGWDYWDSAEAVARALTAPGVTTLVARDDGVAVGAIEVITDGEINWIVGMLIVSPGHRGSGVGTSLVEAAFAASGARRLDLLTEDVGPSFYRRLRGREMVGFRLYGS
jgi:predicted N-acetyltransferase YhbS